MSRKEERILHELFPGTSDFSDEQRALAARVITIAACDSARSRIPGKDIPVGATFSRRGVEYMCVLRPRLLEPCEACLGCAFNASSLHCSGLRCSVFDRADGNNVWFKEVEK